MQDDTAQAATTPAHTQLLATARRVVVKVGSSSLTTAAGARVKVDIRKKPLRITLKDKDRNDRDARVVLAAIDVNKGNKQVAHGIDRVLRPIDL